jgi:hypothetical protein
VDTYSVGNCKATTIKVADDCKQEDTAMKIIVLFVALTTLIGLQACAVLKLRAMNDECAARYHYTSLR